MMFASKVRARLASLSVPLLALLCAIALYVPGPVLHGQRVLHGIDYITLHARRMAFAREALLGPLHELPGWYSRELLGAPFWANVQSFPFIPTRLAVFLFFSPDIAFAAGVALAAALTMVFTWCFARRLGMSAWAAGVVAFTFASSGFVASKVMVGNLPMLEAIPSLPLLLWLVDRVVRGNDASQLSHDWRGLLALAAACACVALAGHPQLVVYAFAVATAYAWVMGARHRAAVTTASSLLGVGCAAVVMVPMVLLVGRSTRILDLEHASNDWALPYSRLLALFLPWRDGFPPVVQHRPWRPWSNPDITLFWDSVNYLGLLPWITLLGLIVLVGVRRCWPGRQAAFWVVIGLGALAMALPFWQAITIHLPGTILRSPSRLMYVVSFALSLAVGAGLDLLAVALRARLGRWSIAVVAVLVVAHVVDITSHARAYVLARDRGPAVAAARETAWLARTIGDGRAGIDYGLDSPHNRRFDDIGYFDSIMLARPYRFVIDTSGMPPKVNQQQMNAYEMQPRTLAAAGVKLVGTMGTIAGLPQFDSFSDGFRLYKVERAAERTRFYGLAQVDFLDASAIHVRLRDPTTDLDARLLLDPIYRKSSDSTPASAQRPSRVEYRRPSSDLIAVGVDAAEPGYVRVLESWDPGWQAAVDGQPVQAIPGNDVFLSAAVPAGRHLVTFSFSTPGLDAGIAVSVGSACLLVLLLVFLRRAKSTPAAR